MKSAPNRILPPLSPGVGFLSNGGKRRYLLEAESSTGFVAWKTADSTILVSAAMQDSIKATPFLTFWSCAGYHDTTPAGRITALDCHGNALTSLNARGLSKLEYLDCSFNELKNLPLDGLTELEGLDADHNRLTTLAVRHLKSLRVLYCAANRLKRLDLSGLSRLQILQCDGNPLQAVNLEDCPLQEEIYQPSHRQRSRPAART
jgi:Leucine-rich repeat (LRR) protein